jgi:Domain of unknown function (DUF4263)
VLSGHPQSDTPTLNVSAEDRFAIVDMATAELAPHPVLVGNLGLTAFELDGWEPVWDLRGAGGVLYQDIIDALREGVSYDRKAPTILVSPDDRAAIESSLELYIRGERRPKVLSTRQKPLPSRPLDLAPFSDDYSGSYLDAFPGKLIEEEKLEEELREDASIAVALGILSEDEAFAYVDQLLAEQASDEYAEFIMDELQAERVDLLEGFLSRIATNSLLAQIGLVHDGHRISVVPMHANSVHEVDCGENVMAVRPARPGAAMQWGRFARAIGELEDLLNTPGAKEQDFEAVLRAHPLFLRGLNYTEAYHQVVLPLGDGQSLRPDIIAEPVSGQWAEVIDLKLPTEPIFAGPADRPRLSAAIAEAAAQLRAYAKWFDDRKVAKRVEQTYGFRCHKPRQVVIIGRDPRRFTEAQREAARTSYPDLDIVTYDRLLAAAKERLLF